MTCLVCKEDRKNCGRGLCHKCHPKFKSRFEPLSKFGRRMPLSEMQGAPEPTDARPGTPEKVAVLEWRAANGYELWHAEDRR